MKYRAMAVLSGVLIPVMITLNGELMRAVGNMYATVFIHVAGLCAILIAMLCARKPLHPGPRLPLYLYLGGVVGVFSVAFSNYAYATLGVSITMALGLLGQLVCSLLIDRYGLLGIPARSLQRSHILSVLLVLIGIALMMAG